MTRLFLLALFTLLAAPFALAAETDAMALALPDAKVVDQNGTALRFRTDLVKDRLVVVNFIFTSCTTICSPMGANFGALQKSLGEKSDVHLISISLDPSTDTPARLRSWSARFGAKEGWTLVTGAREEIESLLRAFGVYTGDRINHAPVLLVGDGARNRWTRGNGLLAPQKIVGMIRTARAAKTAAVRALGEPGQAVADKESHKNIFLVGNLRTGLRKKASGLASSEDHVKAVAAVLPDRG